jgi:hypothetical protein
LFAICSRCKPFELVQADRHLPLVQERTSNVLSFGGVGNWRFFIMNRQLRHWHSLKTIIQHPLSFLKGPGRHNTLLTGKSTETASEPTSDDPRGSLQLERPGRSVSSPNFYSSSILSEPIPDGDQPAWPIIFVT